MGELGVLRGNILVASVKASPRMVWMSLARPMMFSPGTWASDRGSDGDPLVGVGREASRAWPVAAANEMAPWESIAILDFQASRQVSGMGYRKVGTLGGRGLGGGKSGPMDMGRDSVPRTPRWSRKAVGSIAMSVV